MAAIKVSGPLKAAWWMHRKLYRLSGGRIGRRSNGFEVLLLTTRGRKTGETRDVMLQMLPHREGWAVVASYAGEDREPAWRLNLQARPEADIRIRDLKLRVRAREATGAEREDLWARFVAVDDAYAEYAERTSRVIAVVVLEPMS